MRSAFQSGMLKHFFEVSRIMPPEEGKRYLAWAKENTCLREEVMDRREDNHAQTTTRARNP